MLARKHPELKEAVSCVRKMSLSEQWRSVMLDRQNNRMALRGQELQRQIDHEEALKKALTEGQTQGLAQGLAEGKAEGLAEGKAEGKAEGMAEGLEKGNAESKLEIARKMKEMGDSVERIHLITGLSPETVQELVERI